MARSLTTAVLVVAVASVALAGCLSDRERVQVPLTWSPEVNLYEAPAVLEDGWPAQVILRGVAENLEGTTVTLSGIVGSVELVDAKDGPVERTLRPLRLVLNGDGHDVAEADLSDLALHDGDEIVVTFVPASAALPPLPTNRSVPLSLELRWRFSSDDAFDAGRLSFEGNATAERAPGLGRGVAELDGGRLERVVYPAIPQDNASASPPARAQLEVYHVGPDTTEAMSPISLQLASGEGVVLGEPTPKLRLPDRSGYLVLVGNATGGGVVVVPLELMEERTPGPALGFVLVALALVAALAQRRASGPQ